MWNVFDVFPLSYVWGGVGRLSKVADIIGVETFERLVPFFMFAICAIFRVTVSIHGSLHLQDFFIIEGFIEI